jgi:wobble nucleotide-excising tRNase
MGEFSKIEWTDARHAGHAAGQRAIARNDTPPATEQALKQYIEILFKRYNFEEKKCFFCGKHPWTTGVIQGFGAIKKCHDCEGGIKGSHSDHARSHPITI